MQVDLVMNTSPVISQDVFAAEEEELPVGVAFECASLVVGGDIFVCEK
jgi:hypothetical protein